MALVVFGACSKDNPVSPPPQGATVSGVVRDTSSHPVGGALVTLATAPAPGRVTRSLRTGESRTTTTDSTTGKFSFSGVARGDYLLTVDVFRYRSGSQPLHVANDQPGTVVDTIAFALDPEPTGAFSGTVLLERASDHRNTLVTLVNSPLITATDPAGRYSLPFVPLGTWSITASHAGFRDTTITGTLAQENETVTLASLVLSRAVNQLPVVQLAVQGICPDAPTTLRAQAYDPDGTIAGYAWDFENDGVVDSSGAQLAQVVHAYTGGRHVPRVVVTDDEGAATQVTHEFGIEPVDTLFVSATTGNDAGDGSRTRPYATILNALFQPTDQCPSRVIMVAVGYYQEGIQVVTDRSRLELVGGLDPRTWTRQGRNYSAVGPSTFSGLQRGLVSGFEVRSLDATGPGAGSIAVLIENCPATLEFYDCRFFAGKGRAGAVGHDGSDGAPGPDGYPGANGEVGRPGPGGNSGPTGGSGGYGSIFAGLPAQRGFDGRSQSNAVAGSGGGAGRDTSTCATAGAGGDGTAGGGGAPGPHGSGVVLGAPDRHSWSGGYGESGRDGESGAGGGGGGGGGAAYSPSGNCSAGSGGGGGGGGSGGAGGVGGTGGLGGGASIAAVLRNSSVTFNFCLFVTDSAGAGGRGGEGGLGGSGGVGASAGAGYAPGHGSIGGAGGRGGDGGSGGPGGGGRGGPGGPSFGIYQIASSPVFLGNNTIDLGVGGAGGVGGLRGGTGDRAPSGPAGPSAPIGPMPTTARYTP